MLKRFPPCLLLPLLLIASCESRTSPSTLVAATTKQAAVALAERLLDDARLPVGAERSSARLPASLGGPSTPAIGNLVFAHRLWAVDETPVAVWHWLQGHIPPGFVKVETSSGSGRNGASWAVEDGLSTLPLNTTLAQLQFGVAPHDGKTALVRVEAVVGWSNPRPRDETVTASDRVVVVSVLHSAPQGSRSPVVASQVVTTNPKLVQPIVQAFNSLPTSPPDSISGCGQVTPQTVAYQISFSTSPGVIPNLVAVVGKCGPVEVMMRSRKLPALTDQPREALATSAAHVLGLQTPHFH